MSLLAAGADTMIHLVGIRREVGGQTFERLHVEATRRALDASRHAGASRYLQMSALGADPDGVTGYQRTKFAAERLVRASGLDWTIFRPSIIHGPDGEFVQMVKGWATGRKAPWFVMPYFTRLDVGIDKPPFPPPSPEIPLAQPVFVDDVARAFADAMDRPDSIGEVIALGGPDAMTWPDMLKTLRDAMPLAKKSIRPVGLPAPVAIAQARAAALLGFGDALPYSVSDAQMGSQDNVCALDKARATLGYEPRSFAETVEAYGDRV
jgi:NADH dehydrogenase